MGRVSKYKKVKAFDPYAKRSVKERSGLIMSDSSFGVLDSKRKASLKKRARREKRRNGKKKQKLNDGFDLPPKEDDFDLSDPTLSVRKQKVKRLDHGLEELRTSTEVIASTVSLPSNNNNNAEVKTSSRY